MSDMNAPGIDDGVQGDEPAPRSDEADAAVDDDDGTASGPGRTAVPPD